MNHSTAIHAVSDPPADVGIPPPSRRPDAAVSQAQTPSPTCLDREALYAEFTPLVYRLLRQYDRDSERRQDLPGEIYCRFCALLDAYDPTFSVPLHPHLVRQLTAVIDIHMRQQWRRQQQERVLPEPPESLSKIPEVDLPPAWMQPLSQQVVSALPEALMKLPEQQRKVVLWRYYDAKSFEEMGELLGVQAPRVRSLLRQGLKNLRKQLGTLCCDQA